MSLQSYLSLFMMRQNWRTRWKHNFFIRYICSGRMSSLLMSLAAALWWKPGMQQHFQSLCCHWKHSVGLLNCASSGFDCALREEGFSLLLSKLCASWRTLRIPNIVKNHANSTISLLSSPASSYLAPRLSCASSLFSRSWMRFRTAELSGMLITSGLDRRLWQSFATILIGIPIRL